MFVDASAIVAIIAQEADAAALASKLDSAAEAYTSPIAIYEGALGVARLLNAPIEAASALVSDLIEAAEIRSLAIDSAIAQGAIAAFARYGRGRHRAGLNMGDCFAYACAKSLDAPLLCKGDDFRHTDIAIA